MTTTYRTDLCATADSPSREADVQAVLDSLMMGHPLDPVIAHRIDEQADKITEEVRRVHGVIDDKTFYSLLDDEA